MLHLILNFIFGIWALYFNFHKFNVILFYLRKRNKFMGIFMGINGYIYTICNIVKLAFCLKLR